MKARLIVSLAATSVVLFVCGLSGCDNSPGAGSGGTSQSVEERAASQPKLKPPGHDAGAGAVGQGSGRGGSNTDDDE